MLLVPKEMQLLTPNLRFRIEKCEASCVNSRAGPVSCVDNYPCMCLIAARVELYNVLYPLYGQPGL